MNTSQLTEQQQTSVSERFKAVMLDGDLSKGLPIIEWAPWWDKTLANWQAAGLDPQVDAQAHFGLDGMVQIYAPWHKPGIPEPAGHGQGRVTDMESYEKVRPFLFADLKLDKPMIDRWAARRKAGNALMWFTIEGAFWYPRSLFGIEPHLYAFYTEPDLMKRMIDEYTEWAIKTIHEMLDQYEFDFMTFAEDLSYNHGPMISLDLMDQYIAPFYQRVVPELKKRGVMTIVDSDGQIEDLVAWFAGVGIDGILPLERMAGVDVNRIRERHPKFKMLGGFDKTVMHKGEAAMRAEFQRIKPAVMKGYYIPSCDHQTPPAVTMEDYAIYVRLLKEFSEEVAREAARG